MYTSPQPQVVSASATQEHVCTTAQLGGAHQTREKRSDCNSCVLQWFEGQEYDFVFDVDVADGAPPLKLPMNKGDDPYDVAEGFLEKHQLPLSYLEQVVSFILQNSEAEGVLACPHPAASPTS
jgi:hypothetical protein